MDLQTMQSRMLKICGVNGAAIRSSFICELSIEKGYYRHTTIEFLITIPAGYPFFAPTVVCTHKVCPCLPLSGSGVWLVLHLTFVHFSLS